MISFNTDGMVTQYFRFPEPIMDYIFKNLQPQHLIKLYPCCKFFYAKYRLNIIQNIEVVDDGVPESFGLTKTVVRASNPVLEELTDFWISDSLVDQTQAGFVPSFTHCTIKKLELNKHISWENFELLTKSGNIEEMKIGSVFGENGLVSSVDEIISKVPNATSIEISETHFNPTSCTSLFLMNRKVKLSNLVLRNVTPAQFGKHYIIRDFVLRNSTEQCNVYIDFKMLPEVNDLNREINANLAEHGKELCYFIALGLKIKEIEKKLAAMKNERFMARKRTASFP